jgi:hypothetical protein
VETKERKREYNLDRYYADQDKFCEYQRNYYQEHAEEIKARMRRYRKRLAARNRKIADLVVDSLALEATGPTQPPAKDRRAEVEGHAPITATQLRSIV